MEEEVKECTIGIVGGIVPPMSSVINTMIRELRLILPEDAERGVNKERFLKCYEEEKILNTESWKELQSFLKYCRITENRQKLYEKRRRLGRRI